MHIGVPPTRTYGSRVCLCYYRRISTCPRPVNGTASHNRRRLQSLRAEVPMVGSRHAGVPSFVRFFGVGVRKLLGEIDHVADAPLACVLRMRLDRALPRLLLRAKMCWN